MEPFSVQRVIKLRQQIHAHPEGGFLQFETKKRIQDFLVQIGIPAQIIQEKAKTGLVVDLRGKKPAVGNKRTIALRADMDALSMVEDNPHLSYKSKNEKYAHMCGHDGHVACLAAFSWKYLKYLNEIPQNRIVKLIFQPCQQGPQSGARLMIQQGVLEEVDEVYAYHNIPVALPGQIYIQEGPMMAEAVVLKIKVIGTMGHGSAPQNVKDSIKASVRIYSTISQTVEQLTSKKHHIKCTIPVFKGGQRENVFSSQCNMQGSARSLQKGMCTILVNKIKQVIAQLELQGFTIEFNPHFYAPVVFNAKQQTAHVYKVVKQLYGQQNVSKKHLPVPASDDFAYFLQQKPGCYFFASSSLPERNAMVHSNQYDFNDSIIEKISQVWLKLALNRMSQQ